MRQAFGVTSIAVLSWRASVYLRWLIIVDRLENHNEAINAMLHEFCSCHGLVNNFYIYVIVTKESEPRDCTDMTITICFLYEISFKTCNSPKQIPVGIFSVPIPRLLLLPQFQAAPV